MVPAVFMFLDALPVNAFGKVDRLALPDPTDRLRAGADEPRTETERVLAQIWRESLEVDQLGIHDNFFDVGGNSLRATRTVARTREAFQRHVPLRRLFEDPTIARLGAWLDANADGEAAPSR
jgi:aryl carrier-like protein